MATSDPDLLAIILCEKVIEDVNSRNKTFVDTFNQVWATKVPVVHPAATVVVTLTECRRKTKLELEFSLDKPDGSQDPIFAIQGELSSNDPLAVHDFVFNIRGLPLKAYGTYRITLRSLDSGNILGQRKFYVRPLKRGDKS